MRAEWKELTADLNQTLPISLPRIYFSNDVELSTSATLCGFCDASTKAYAAVVYLLLKTETHKMIRFVAAKTRVAPVQAQMIPGLELLSAFLLSKFVVSVCDCLLCQLTPLDVRM